LGLADYRGAAIFRNINPLAVPAISVNHIEGQLRVKAVDSPDILERVGLGLQHILRNEYGEAYRKGRPSEESVAIMKLRNPLLAHLTPREALHAVKRELRDYTKGEEPFNRRFRSGENVRDWWVAVQKDQFGQVLGVREQSTCALHY
jgi:hypothetical protein